jgi:hypothetical protein
MKISHEPSFTLLSLSSILTKHLQFELRCVMIDLNIPTQLYENAIVLNHYMFSSDHD